MLFSANRLIDFSGRCSRIIDHFAAMDGAKPMFGNAITTKDTTLPAD
jgi:hypothetical protein